MSYLLLDLGNTRIKARLIDTYGKLIDTFRLDYAQMDTISSFIAHHKVLGVYMVSVVSTERKHQLIEHLKGYPIYGLDTQSTPVALSNLYQSHQLGHDRWFAALGAYHYHHQQAFSEQVFLHMSFGTATTVDTVYQQQFLGGLILPGLNLMIESLFKGTAQLPAISLSEDDIQDFPKTTQNAIATGIVAAQVGAVMRQVNKAFEHYQQVPVLYVSGGASDHVLPELRKQCEASEKLASVQIIGLESPVLDGIEHYILHKGI